MSFSKQESLQRYSPPVLRIGLSLVLLWFGANQVLSSQSWTSWLPTYASAIPISAANLVFINGAFEVTLGLLLLIGIYTRITALILSLHLLIITLSIGYNDVAIRDFGLFIAALAIALNGADEWCLDRRFADKNS